MQRSVYEPRHEAFRGIVRRFLEQEVVPEYHEWEAAARPPRSFWPQAAAVGILGIGVAEQYGGLAGSDFRHSAIVTEEAQRLGLALGGVRVHTDICMPYVLEYATAAQRERWLPRLTSGRAVVALAMSEPGTGSDMKSMATTAVRRGDQFIVAGTKTFISNGLEADLVLLAVKTDPAAGRRGISILVVEADTPGFERGRSLEKLGLKAQDLAELSFTEMAVPAENLLGRENHGFDYLTSNLAQERLSIAVNSQAAAVATLDRSVAQLQDRGDVGQHAKFEMATCAVEVAAGQALVDQALAAHVAGTLDPSDAAAVKLYATELQGRVGDRCLQVNGPDAYRRGAPIGQAFADGRVSRIYGGSSEIMRVLVAKGLGL